MNGKEYSNAQENAAQYDVFVSYRWIEPDQTWVRQSLVPALRAAGLRVFLDVEDFVPGRDIILEMSRAGLESRRALCILTPDYFEGARMVGFESQIARRRDPTGNESHLIPLVLRPTELPEWIRGLIPVDWTDPDSHLREWGKLLRVLDARNLKAPPPSVLFDSCSTQPEPTEAETIFLPPRFREEVKRQALIEQIHALLKQSSLVAVEGLPGTGKTHLVAACLGKPFSPVYEKVFWHDTEQGELVDALLSEIEPVLKLDGASPASKCKSLVHRLADRQAVLVVDDFHQVDQVSFGILLRAASLSGNPARLILLSRHYVDLLKEDEAVGHIAVWGFREDELREFLRLRSVELNLDLSSRLNTVTEGLPLAAALFVTLVKRFGRDPEDLLSHSMVATERLRSWFAEIESRLGPEERSLLSVLSVCEGPFNLSLARRIARSINATRPESAIDSLQRAYLLQEYSPYRWNVHALIASFASSNLSNEQRRNVLLSLADDACRGIHLPKHRIASDREFAWLARACKYFQLAGNFGQSEKILHTVAKTAKLAGYCETFIKLARVEIAQNMRRSKWIDYHLAHCCLIVGRFRQGLTVIEPLIYLTPDRPEDHIAYSRLYAEFLATMGDIEKAYQFLASALTIVAGKKISRVTMSQALSAKVWLLTKLERYQEATQLNAFLLDDSLIEKDTLGQAIHLTRDGVLSYAQKSYQKAIDSLEAALLTFKQTGDNRGFAWCLGYLALSRMKSGKKREGIQELRETIRIQNDARACSIDYYEILLEFKSSHNSTLQKLINDECSRLESMLQSVR